MKHSILSLLVLITGLGASQLASADEYNCRAANLRSYFVFDDGPGGLDYFQGTYKDHQYTDVIYPDQPSKPNVFEISDDNTPDGEFEYSGGQLAIMMFAKDQTTFLYEAKALHASPRKLEGKVTITENGVTRVLPLHCKLN